MVAAAGFALLQATLTIQVTAAESPAAASDTTVVTPVQAAGIVNSIWHAREDALSRGDRATIEELETGPALEHDLAWLEGRVTLRPGGDGPRSLYEQLVLVPEQHSYPASFLAILGFSNGSDQRVSPDVWSEVMALTKADATAPWQVGLEALTWDPVWTLPGKLGVTGGESYAPLTSGPLRIDPSAIQRPLAHSRGWEGEFPTGSVYWAGLAGGAALVCFSQYYHKVHNQPWWHPEHVAANDVRGIPSGFYKATSARFVEERCVVDPPAQDPTAQITEVAARGTVIAHSELPANPPPWFLIGLVGFVVLAVLGVIVVRLKPGPPTSRPVRPLRWTEIERDTALHGATLILMWALILVEIERWAIDVSLLLAVPLAVVPTLWLLAMVPSPLRTITVAVRARVDRSPEELFALIADPRNHRLWESELETVEAKADGPPAVGMEYRQRQRLANGLRVEFETAISEYELNRRYSTRMIGFWHPQRFSWTFQPSADGKTLLISTVSAEVSPLYAISGALLNRGRFVRHIQQARKTSVMRLLRFLSGIKEERAETPTPTDDAQRIHAWMRRRPDLFKFGLGLSVASFVVTLGSYVILTWFWPGPWLGIGIAGLLFVHEMGHYLYGRYAHLAPDPPVFVVVAAFVANKKRAPEGLTLARSFGAGAFLAALAVAALLALYALTNFEPFLVWALCGAALNLMGSLLPFKGTDGVPLMAAFAQWLPLIGILFGLALFAGAASLGYVSPLLPVIGFLAVLAVSQRFRTDHLALYWRLTPAARLMLGTTALTMVLYLAGVLFLTANWT